MPEPVTLTAATIATLILTKAFEKTGEKVTDAVWKQGEKLLALLKHKAPETAEAIARADDQVVPEIALAAQNDPEIAIAVQELEAVVMAEPTLALKAQTLAAAIKIRCSPPLCRTMLSWLRRLATSINLLSPLRSKSLTFDSSRSERNGQSQLLL